MRLPTLALALLGAAAPARALLPLQDPGRASLEELLERVRARAAEQRERLERELAAILADFERGGPQVSAERRQALTEALVRLGPDVPPLLVALLDPATDDDALAQARAKAAAAALARLPSIAVTDALLALLAEGGSQLQLNALTALETTPEPERVRDRLFDTFQASEGAVKRAALRALVRVGGEGVHGLLAGVLQSRDPDLVDLALGTLAETRAAELAPRVAQLLQDRGAAARHAERLVAFYRALPGLVDAQVLEGLVQIVAGSAGLPTRLAVVTALPDLVSGSTSDLRRALEPLVQRPERELREAVLVALVRLGDRNARRDLLRPYDEFVDKNDRFPDGFVRRGEIHLRIEDWNDAIKDFQQAIRLARDDPRPQPEAYIGLARGYARRGRLKDAAEWLRKAPISMSDLRALADDPDFAELRDSRYAKEAFGL